VSNLEQIKRIFYPFKKGDCVVLNESILEDKDYDVAKPGDTGLITQINKDKTCNLNWDHKKDDCWCNLQHLRKK